MPSSPRFITAQETQRSWPTDNNNSGDNQAQQQQQHHHHHHRIIAGSANDADGFGDNLNPNPFGSVRPGGGGIVNVNPTVAESGYGGGDLATALYGGDCHRGGNAMSSYLPLRHPGAHHGVPSTPRGPVGGEDNVMHGMGGMMDSSGYMEHFLNIPEICPTGNYRNTRYYMGAYNAEACRMEAPAAAASKPPRPQDGAAGLQALVLPEHEHGHAFRGRHGPGPGGLELYPPAE
ncbi:hypothetical protein Btru_017864 [Bulinus truncatus]|nr:hypothetical protein Btru_017864 [Bulinus truncatus]